MSTRGLQSIFLRDYQNFKTVNEITRLKARVCFFTTFFKMQFSCKTYSFRTFKYHFRYISYLYLHCTETEKAFIATICIIVNAWWTMSQFYPDRQEWKSMHICRTYSAETKVNNYVPCISWWCDLKIIINPIQKNITLLNIVVLFKSSN